MRIGSMLAGVLCLLTAMAAPAGNKANDDLRRMEGTWTARVLSVLGKSLAPEDQTKLQIKFVVKGDHYTVYMGGDYFCCGTLKLDPSKNPPTIDSIAIDGLQKGKIQPGIYRIESNDEMKVVFTDPDLPRPTEFRSRRGTQEVFVSYKRVPVTQTATRECDE